MNNNKLLLLVIFNCLILISCDNKPENVRELMESEGWTFCKTVTIDTYDEDKEHGNLIIEDAGTFDLFMKKNGDYNQFAITRHNTDDIPLKNYDKNTEADHFKASTWINYYVEEGIYTLRADHVKSGNSTRLGVITKHYTGKGINKGRDIYLNVTPNSGQESFNTDQSNDYSNETQVNYEEETEPVKKYTQCPLCFGTRRCGGCGGGGLVYNAIDYNPGQYENCSACGGTGLCSMCEGSGMIEDYGW